MAKAKVDKKFMAAVLGMATLGAGLFGYGGYKRFGAFNTPAQASAPQQAPQRPMAAKPAPAKPIQSPGFAPKAPKPSTARTPSKLDGLPRRAMFR